MSRAHACIGLAVLAVLVLMLSAGLTRQAEGSHIPIGVAAIDTDVTGNGASTVGTIQPCGQIAAVGQTREIDVVLESVPAEGLAGAAFNLNYDPSKIKIISPLNANIMMADAFSGFSEAVPDTDGSFRVEMADISVPDPPAPPGYASGDGTLVRLTVEAVGNGSTPIYMTDLLGGDFKPDFLDPNGNGYQVAMLGSGQITVGPATCADPTPTPTASPTPVPSPTDWDPPVKKLNGWTWYRFPSGLTTSYWYECGVSDADCRSRWTTPYQQAAADWNSRPSAARLSVIGDEIPTAEIVVDTIDEIFGQPSVLGLARAFEADFDPCPTNCTVRWGEAWLADDRHVGPYGTTYDRRATVSHEIGHLLALAHESVSEQCGVDGGEAIPHSVMAYDCIDPPSLGGEGENWVQDFDVCGVNVKYPSGFGDAGCVDAPTVASYFHSLPPCRVLDTRDGTGAPIGKVGPGLTLNLQVAETCGVASMPQVSAVVLNLTVTQPTAAGVLTVFPSDASLPLTSNLNFVPGETRPNAVTVRIGADGKVKINNQAGQSHVVADVLGYYGPVPGGGARYNPLPPTRIMDTRSGLNGPLGKIGQNQTLTFQVAGRPGIPASGVDSVVMNVTVTEPSDSSFLTLYPANQAQKPNASSLNFTAGQTVPNLVTVKLSPDGKVKIYNLRGGVHVVMDVAGWYTTGAQGELFHAVTPARAQDTRFGTGGRTGKLGNNGEVLLRVATVGGLPPVNVAAVVLNGTVTGPTLPSVLTIYPANESKPVASNLNFAANQTVPNSAIVKASPDGRVKIHNLRGDTHVIVDVAGWFGP